MGGPARRVVEYNFEHYRKKGGGLADYCLWERVYLEIDCIREKIHRCRKISKRELCMGLFAPFSLQKENFVVQSARDAKRM